MIYWNNLTSTSRDWRFVWGGLSGEGTFFEQCAEYCSNKDGCNANTLTRTVLTDDDSLYDFFVNIGFYTDGHAYQWYYSVGEFYSGPTCWGSTCNDPEDLSETTQLGVWRDYYKANPEYLPSNEPDGIFGADCSSGTCECSAGFIDKGNGCEAMTEEQAETTLAPTTTQAPSDQPTEYLTSLLGKLESVFEANRPGKARTHLSTKWKNLEEKCTKRYDKMKADGCEFAEQKYPLLLMRVLILILSACVL